MEKSRSLGIISPFSQHRKGLATPLDQADNAASAQQHTERVTGSSVTRARFFSQVVPCLIAGKGFRVETSLDFAVLRCVMY